MLIISVSHITLVYCVETTKLIIKLLQADSPIILVFIHHTAWRSLSDETINVGGWKWRAEMMPGGDEWPQFHDWWVWKVKLTGVTRMTLVNTTDGDSEVETLTRLDPFTGRQLLTAATAVRLSSPSSCPRWSLTGNAAGRWLCGGTEVMEGGWRANSSSSSCQPSAVVLSKWWKRHLTQRRHIWYFTTLIVSRWRRHITGLTWQLYAAV